MSRRGRSRGGNYYRYNDKAPAYQSRGTGYKNSYHDNRTARDQENGEFDSYGSFGNYNSRGYRGGGKYRGQPRRSRGSRGAYRGGRRQPGMYSSSDGGSTDRDGDVDMDGRRDTTRRVAPYHRTGRGGPRPQHQPPQRHRWYLITIFDAGMLDQAWLIDAIQKETMTQIVPVQYYSDEKHASFCIEQYDVAMAIKNCSRKIETPDGSKLAIAMKPCSPPITNDKIPVLKEVMSERYNTGTSHLDLSSLYPDKKLRENNIELKMSSPREMYIIVHLIGENIPGLLSLDLSDNRLFSLADLKRLVMFTPRLQGLVLKKNQLRRADDLDQIKDWDLKELNIDGNPLCDNYQSQTDYVSAVRDRFPNLETLDGKKLPPPVKFDLERITKLVPAVPYYLPSEVKNLITQFVQQYFSLYDTDRTSLSQAYDENCTFSLTIPTAPHGPPLNPYYSHSRNLTRLKHPGKKISFLRYPKTEVCTVLGQLPGTQHDIPGFSVDVPLMSSNLVKFIIRGVFKEKGGGKSKDVTRAFSRSFLCLTNGSILSIINDQLHVRNANGAELRSAFAKPPVTPSPSPVPEHAAVLAAASSNIASNVASPSKMDIVSAFSKESGMNAKFSEICLAENQWDYQRAGQAFLSSKEKGMIPPEAYIQ